LPDLGVHINANEDKLVEMVLDVARGKLTKKAIADFFRRNAQGCPSNPEGSLD